MEKWSEVTNLVSELRTNMIRLERHKSALEKALEDRGFLDVVTEIGKTMMEKCSVNEEKEFSNEEDDYSCSMTSYQSVSESKHPLLLLDVRYFLICIERKKSTFLTDSLF